MGCRMCERPKMRCRKGLWSPQEDEKLRDCILQHGLGSWSSIAAKAGLERNGKSCRLRWINYLRPGLKRGGFTPEEEGVVLKLHVMLGNKWSQIAKQLPGRTDNEVKNHWNTYLKKKLLKVDGDGGKPPKHEPVTVRRSQISLPESSSSESLGSHEQQTITHPGDPKATGAAQARFPRLLFVDWLPVLSADDGRATSSSALDGRTSCSQLAEHSTANSEAISLLQFDMDSSAIFEDLDQTADATFHGLLSYTGFELNHELFVNL